MSALAPRRRLVIVSSGAVLALLVGGSTRLGGSAANLRDWLPALWVLFGYWISGLFFTHPMPAVEVRLLHIDRRFLRALAGNGPLTRAPRIVLEGLELAYALCYLLVPAGYFVLAASGHAEVADRYWTTVLSAELASYGMLPWIQTRPPRTVEPAAERRSRPVALRALNLFILGRGSIQVNTIPSGHAAGAMAVALSVATVLPAAGAVFLALAIAIMVASVAGRYHYAVDAALGALVGIIAWLVVWS
jgi:hypothetical protein